MSYEKVFSWHQPLDLRDLCVPINKCISVKLGAIDKMIVEKLEKYNYDQAPIVDNNCVYGLISTQRLKELLNTNQPLTKDDPEILGEDRVVWGTEGVQLDYLFSKLSETRATLVQDEYDGGEYGTAMVIHGLITISDLNRHALRTVLYRMISVLEVDLVHVIEKYFSEPWDWLKHLNEEAQVKILGYWQLSERKGVDIGPLAAANFTHLLQVIEKTQDLLGELGFSAKDYARCIKGMPELRNRIMHSVRPLILDIDDVKWLHNVIGCIIDFGIRVEALLKEWEGQRDE
ncbi:MAG: hypothetical protein NT066_06840 [Candidatus Omnitrophica bacterium]|nr:hypothetical protein [Candidatus Omnitrophota bacterium]